MFGGRGSEYPEGRRRSQPIRGRGGCAAPVHGHSLCPGQGSGNAAGGCTLRVTWPRTGELERAQRQSGRGSLSGLTVLHLAALCTEPGQAETDRCTHLDRLTHAHFLEFTLNCMLDFFFFLVDSSRAQKGGRAA